MTCAKMGGNGVKIIKFKVNIFKNIKINLKFFLEIVTFIPLSKS